MTAVASKLMTQPLRVAIFASEPRRLATLARWLGDLGHVVVTASDHPSVVLTDGVVAGAGNLPTVALGVDSETYQARLPSDASRGQIDAALRAVAVGLSVTIADEFSRGFEAAHEDDERTLLTPREVEVLTAVSNGLTNKEIARNLAIPRTPSTSHLPSLLPNPPASSPS